MKVETDIITSIYHRKFDRTGCDTSENVCRDLQNCPYCFNLQNHNVLDFTPIDNFQYQESVL